MGAPPPPAEAGASDSTVLRGALPAALLALVLALQVHAFLGEHGYQLADSVEHMERARTFVRDQEMVDAGAIRPFGFASLLVPFFVVWDWLGIELARPLTWSFALLQMALGLVLVAVTVRIGARIGGRAVGLVAGFLVGTNPIFLQYTTQPVSGIAAAAFVALGVERLLERGSARASLVGGLWLGAGFLMAYQTLLVIMALVAMILVRDRLAHLRIVRGIALGVAIAVLVQIGLDWMTYGTPGISVGNYVVQNFSNVIVGFLLEAEKVAPGGAGQTLREAATRIYELSAELQQEGPVVVDPGGVARQIDSKVYYLVSLPQMWVWPALGLGALGIARAVVRPRWTTTLLLGVFAINAVVMSYKGSKSFRLWLPLLAVMAPLFALGWATLVDAARGSALRPVLRAAAVVALVCVPVFALRELASLNPRRFGGYWDAMAWVNERAASHGPRTRFDDPNRRTSVACAYNWAVFMREAPGVDLVKLPWQLNHWDRYEPSEKADDLDVLDELDLFVTHLPILDLHRDLMEWIDRHYQVAALFYDQATYEDLGPIVVLERLDGDPRAPRLYERVPGGDPEAWRATHDLDPPLAFVSELEPADGEDRAARDELVLLGADYRTLPPQGLGWITYHWYAPAALARDWLIVDRLTAPDERNAWDNNHVLGHGAFPTSTLAAGDIVREGYPVVLSAEPFLANGPYRPIGGGYRRGDLVPLALWMKLVLHEPEELPDDAGQPTDPAELPRLVLARPGTGRPLRDADERGAGRTADGFLFSPDDLVQVGGFLAPVQPRARLADDGRPIPEDR